MKKFGMKFGFVLSLLLIHFVFVGIVNAVPIDLYILSGQSMASGYNGATEYGSVVADLDHYYPEYRLLSHHLLL